MRGVPIRVLPALFALLALAAASGCNGGGSGGAVVAPTRPVLAFPADPADAGPYAVGVTTRTWVRPSTTTGEPRSIETYVWYPAAAGGTPDDGLKASKEAPPAAGAPFPLVIFSHGSGGNPRQSVFFTSRLASYGFVVAAPSHPGNTTADCFPCFEQAGVIDSALNRPDDVRFVVDQLLAINAESGDLLAGAIDGDRIGLSGHSFGGYTTLVTDGPFRARLAMAPPSLPVMRAAVERISVPTMIMSGEIDSVVAPDQQRTLYGELASGITRYLLTLRGAGHLSFSDICLPAFPGCRPGDLDPAAAHDRINRYGIAFLMKYVAGDDRYAAYLADGRPADAAVTLESGG